MPDPFLSVSELYKSFATGEGAIEVLRGVDLEVESRVESKVERTQRRLQCQKGIHYKTLI